jgi:hypothetical protein
MVNTEAYRRYKAKGLLMWSKDKDGNDILIDEKGNIIDQRKISKSEVKARLRGSNQNKNTKRTLPAVYYRIKERHEKIKILRTGMRDALSLCAFHERNLEELTKKMDMLGNPEPGEKETLFALSTLQYKLGKEQLNDILLCVTEAEAEEEIIQNSDKIINIIKEEIKENKKVEVKKRCHTAKRKNKKQLKQ